MSADTNQKGAQQDGAQQDSNPVGQWFSGTWQKMPWTGGDKDDSANAHASADVKVQAGAKPADPNAGAQQSTDGTGGVNEQLAGFWSKTTGLFENLAPKTSASDSSTTANANASGDVKVQAGAKTDTQQSTDGTAGVNEQLAGFWTKTTGFFEHLTPKTSDSDSTATANANANGDVKVQAGAKPADPNAGTQQSADGTAGVNEQLAGFWSKTTGFFEHLTPKTSDSDSTATTNANASGDVKVQASATKPKDDQKVDTQQSSSGGVNEQLAGFWSKTTGLFENLAPKTNDSESTDTNKQASS